MGVQRILCEPGRWHDKTLDDTDVNNHITGRGITDVIGPSAASCSNWFPKSARYHQDTVEVDASSYVYSGLGEANTRSHCHVLPIGADVDVNDIGYQQGNPSAEKLRYRVPFAGLQRAADAPAGGGAFPARTRWFDDWGSHRYCTRMLEQVTQK